MDNPRVVITGGNSGIGYAIAKKLMLMNYKVVITVRDDSKGVAAATQLENETNQSNIEFITGHLDTIQSVQALAEDIKQRYRDLKILINNAGVWKSQLETNSNGLELSFMVNHLAPYILAIELQPLLANNAPARIININAGLYVNGAFDLEKTPYGKDFGSIRSYANTKLCNVLATLHLSKLFANSGVTINAVHPGVINTGLGESDNFLSKVMRVVKKLWKSPDYGATAPVWLATEKVLEDTNGQYFDEMEIHKLDPKALDQTQQADLVKCSEQLIAAAIPANSSL